MGIGTTSPSNKLDVVGSILAQSSGYVHVRVDQTDSGMIDMGITSGTAEGFLNVQNTGAGHVATAPEFKLLLNSSEKMRVDGSGNVGIGTTSPSYTLDVVGDFRARDNSNQLVFAEHGTSAIAELKIIADTAHDAAIYFGDAVDNVRAGFYYDVSANQLQFRGYDNGNRMVISSNGNVGIGTTAPSERLDISHNGDSTNGILVTNSSVGTSARASLTLTSDSARIDFYATSNAYNGVSGWNDAGIISTSSNSSNGLILNSQVGGIKFQDATSTIMVVSDGGNVGIGTTSPSQKLDVNGSVNVGSGIVLLGQNKIDGSSDNLKISADYGNVSGSSSIEFLTDGTEKVRITSAGNVGIGTTSPSARLEVYRNLQSDTINRANSAAFMRGQDIGLAIGQYASSPYGTWLQSIKTNDTTYPLSLNPLGSNVGIGTSSPVYKLDVSGDIRATGEVIAYSDARVKENVETIHNALEKVTAMRGVNYNKIGEQKRSTGVIAQELLEILPEAVHQDEEGMYSVAYGNVVGVLIEAIKEQQKQIDELKKMLG